jgi:hypothetical protein
MVEPRDVCHGVNPPVVGARSSSDDAAGANFVASRQAATPSSSTCGALPTGMVRTTRSRMTPSTRTLRVLDPTGTEVFSSAYAVTVIVAVSSRVALPAITIRASTTWAFASYTQAGCPSLPPQPIVSGGAGSSRSARTSAVPDAMATSRTSPTSTAVRRRH